MELSKSARQTLSRAIQDAAEQSAQKLSKLFRRQWQASDVRLGFNLNPTLIETFVGDDEAHCAAIAPFPGGKTFVSFPEKSLPLVGKALFPVTDQKRLQALPDFGIEVMHEISNVVLNQFVGALADSCQMGFAIDAPKIIPRMGKKLLSESLKSTLADGSRIGAEWLIRLSCPSLGTDCALAIQLDPAMTSRMLHSLTVIYASGFLDVFVGEISAFLIPLFALTLGATGTQIGWLNACPMLLSLLTAFLSGQLSDRFGRRPVLLFGAGVRALSMSCVAFARSLPFLFFGWAADGAAQNSLDTASAYISDITMKYERFQKLTFLGIATFLPNIIGPCVGGWLAKGGFSWAYAFCAGVASLNLLMLYALLPESRSSNTTNSSLDIFDFSTMKSLVLSSQIRRLVAISFLVQFSSFSIYQTLIIYAAQYLSYSTQGIGYFLSFMGLISVIVRSLLGERLVKSFGESIVLSLGILLVCMGSGLLPYARGYWTVLGTAGLVAFGTPLIGSCLSVLLSFNASSKNQGAVYGLDSTCSGLGAGIGMLAAGLLYDRISPTTPFFIASLLMALGLLLSNRLWPRH